jgi:hypothetical protein
MGSHCTASLLSSSLVQGAASGLTSVGDCLFIVYGGAIGGLLVGGVDFAIGFLEIHGE